MTYQTYQIKLSSGIHTYCEVGDSERTLLLLHGFSFRQGMYPLLKVLDSDFKVVLPDLPFSNHLNFSKPHTLDNYVDFILEFVQTLGLQNVSIFGNSVGGTLALMCGIKHPDQFEKLVVRCPLWSSKQLPGYLQIKPLVRLHHYLSGSELYANSAIKLFYYLSSRMSPVIGAKSKSPIPYNNGQVDPVVLSRFLGHLVEVEFESGLRFIPNETLIIWGELDMFIQSEWGLHLDRLLPTSQYLEMEGEYHNIATADTCILAKSIFEFVE